MHHFGKYVKLLHFGIACTGGCNATETFFFNFTMFKFWNIQSIKPQNLFACTRGIKNAGGQQKLAKHGQSTIL